MRGNCPSLRRSAAKKYFDEAHRQGDAVAPLSMGMFGLPLGALLESPGMVPSLTLGQLQARIRDLYGAKDAARGIEGTFMWFMEEVGELSAALRSGPRDELMLEFADVIAWLVTLANCSGIDLDEAIERKYGGGCPKCRKTPCVCVEMKP